MLVGLWNCINSFLIEHGWKIYFIDSHGDVGQKWAAYFLPKSFLGGRREPAAKKGSLRCQTFWSWCHEQSVDGAEPGLCLGPLVSDIWSNVKQNFNASAFLLLSISELTLQQESCSLPRKPRSRFVILGCKFCEGMIGWREGNIWERVLFLLGYREQPFLCCVNFLSLANLNFLSHFLSIFLKLSWTF